jgi:SAM-dependent methyltransferase
MSENAAVSSLWYKQWFGRDYLRVYPSRDDRAAAIESRFIQRALSLQPGDLVLDLCCGTGRHSAALRDLRVMPVGLDLSAELLDVARGRKVDLMLVRGDMRKVPFRTVFDAALSLFTSFGYFDDDGNRAVLREVASVLKPGGKLFVDHINREHVIRNLVPRSERNEGGMQIVEERRFDAQSERLMKEVSITDSAGTRSYTESVRVFEPEELREIIVEPGFKVLETFGDFEGHPCGPENPRLIIVARKSNNR